MKNWWQRLSEPKRAGLLLVFVAIGLFLALLAITYAQTTDGKVTFDSAKQEIRPKLNFREWLFDWWGPGERYVALSEEFTFVGLVNGMAYKAKFRLPPDNQSVKKFLVGTNTKSEKFLEAVARCVETEWRNYSIIDNQTMTIRAMSLANMNDLCPLAPEYGYQWAGNLEIAQCFVDEPKDNWQKEFCVNLVERR